VIAEVLAFCAAAGAAAAAADIAHAARAGRSARPPFALLARAGARLLPRAAGALPELDRRIAEAGRPGGMRARDLLAAKLAGALAGAGAGMAVATFLPGRLGVLAALAGPGAGFLVPDAWLARRRTERLAAARRDLPALLDLLRVAVDAGVSLPEALAEVARRSRAPLARLWGGLAAQVAVGVPLADALDAHRAEVPVPEVEAFTRALARAARHGAPLSETLASQARDARLARRRAIQEEAARAGPKMQLVVALMLVPSVMLVVAAALLSALAGGGAGGLLSGF
jgi:tight adherence protein C